MSLRWRERVDFFQRGDEQFHFRIERQSGVGVVLSGFVSWIDDEGVCCSESCFDSITFDSMSKLEFFYSLKKREYEINISGLISRTYIYKF